MTGQKSHERDKNYSIERPRHQTDIQADTQTGGLRGNPFIVAQEPKRKCPPQKRKHWEEEEEEKEKGEVEEEEGEEEEEEEEELETEYSSKKSH